MRPPGRSDRRWGVCLGRSATARARRRTRRYTLVAGYLLIGSREKARFKTRFFVVEEPTADTPELLLSVYKTAACEKRLNAIATNR